MNLWKDRPTVMLGRTAMSRAVMIYSAMIGVVLAGLLSACTPPAIDDYPAQSPETMSGAAPLDSAATTSGATPRAASASSAVGTRAAEAAVTASTATEGAAAPDARSAGAALTVMAADDAKLGAHLVDGEGRTLYLFTSDTTGKSTCTGSCAETWAPALTDATPLPGDGVDAALMGVTLRDDGRAQVTYKGHPLYYFSADAAGEASGQGTRGVWYVVSPAGDKVE